MQLNLLKVENCSEQDTQNLEEYIRQLYTYIKKQLQFTVNPTIRLIDDAENGANPLGQTGHYEPETRILTVYITDRHVKDILRSIAHELIHHNQNCNNQISPEADMSEGYVQKDESLRALEEEAYSKGNLLFRDWENQMKENDEQLYESLDNYREKRLRLITEGIYEKFGFSTEFLKEARKSPPPPTLGDSFGKILSQKKSDPAIDERNRKAVLEIVVPGLEHIRNIMTEYNQTLTQRERNERALGYGGARIRTLEANIGNLLSAGSGDVIVGVLQTLYQGIGKMVDHFNTQPDDSLTSSTGRIQDTISKRMQVWGPKMLQAWVDINAPIILTLVETAIELIKLDRAKYEKVPVVYRPENAKEKSVQPGDSTLQSFASVYRKVKEVIMLARQTQPDAAAAAVPATAATAPAQTAAPTGQKKAAKKAGNKAPAKPEDDDDIAKPEKVGISDDTLSKLSETRQNTLNTLRLLESLTGKGK